MRDKLFSITPKDLKMDVFRAGGHGGQHANKSSTGVRFRHLESGAIGESREFKSQLQNKRAAFRRLAESKEMQLWIKKEAAKSLLSKAELEEIERNIAIMVERMTSDEHLKVEVHDEKGKWVEVDHSEIQ